LPPDSIDIEEWGELELWPLAVPELGGVDDELGGVDDDELGGVDEPDELPDVPVGYELDDGDVLDAVEPDPLAADASARTNSSLPEPCCGLMQPTSVTFLLASVDDCCSACAPDDVGCEDPVLCDCAPATATAAANTIAEPSTVRVMCLLLTTNFAHHTLCNERTIPETAEDGRVGRGVDARIT
jgi:hypothetical protein